MRRGGGMRVVDLRAPRPWRVRWKRYRGHQLVAANGQVVAEGFRRMWDALTWAQGKGTRTGKGGEGR